MNRFTSLAAMSQSSPEYRYLFGIAYRILGSVHDAQDAVQDALERWLKLTTAQQADIRDPQAWLVRVVGRVCLDQAGSARARHETYPGIWLPEPIIGSHIDDNRESDPERIAELSESISIAMLSAMERLSPIERLSFILHDVFQVSFAEIAATSERSVGACKQAAAAARARLSRPARYVVSETEQASVVNAFKDACNSGDLNQLISILAPDVISRADGGATVRAARKPIIGAERVATYLMTLMAQQARAYKELTIRVEPINQRTGLTIWTGNTLIAALDITVQDGLIEQLALIVAPEKLSQNR